MLNSVREYLKIGKVSSIYSNYEVALIFLNLILKLHYLFFTQTNVMRFLVFVNFNLVGI